MKIKSGFVGVAVTAALFAGMSSAASAALIGPLVDYEGFADSPFSGQSYSYFHLETFESGALAAPGVTASSGVVVGPGFEVDSVDGHGANGHSFFDLNGARGLTFTFDAAVLGQLPTDVGIVWTDGDGPNRYFTAYDQNGVSLGTITDNSPLFFSSGGDGDFQNYRFFGATNSGGISKIFIANDNGGIEVDHLQYGARSDSVPEPAGWALMIGGFGLAGAALRRRRAQVATA
jgi:hypothetical protein